MQVIGCGDDNCIGKFRDIEYFFPIAETVLIGDTIQIFIYSLRSVLMSATPTIFKELG